ncbi:hypothetical protein C6P45_001576 [Maudiozyma exigua]|uniref:RNase MRP protein 1 RNA binding domain-containing protein n=1 Tax=Maudiozyma exigua TaxID=34358 RepID=A0A9P6W0Q4_MAUEX|nr:hypothetical protein C6P45_001576 [Kazachstania exigua]
MYYEFNGVITLGQFPTLGVVLIGHLSRIHHLFKELLPLIDKQIVDKNIQKQNDNLEQKIISANDEELETLATENNEELGEIITETEIQDSKEPSSQLEAVTIKTIDKVQDKRNTKNKVDKIKKKKNKSKRSKSAIDSIFG